MRKPNCELRNVPSLRLGLDGGPWPCLGVGWSLGQFCGIL
jgi:hypothetical protein